MTTHALIPPTQMLELAEAISTLLRQDSKSASRPQQITKVDTLRAAVLKASTGQYLSLCAGIGINPTHDAKTLAKEHA